VSIETTVLQSNTTLSRVGLINVTTGCMVTRN